MDESLLYSPLEAWESSGNMLPYYGIKHNYGHVSKYKTNRIWKKVNPWQYNISTMMTKPVIL